jgi:uncharacterized MAPEG superfamily protein
MVRSFRPTRRFNIRLHSGQNCTSRVPIHFGERSNNLQSRSPPITSNFPPKFNLTLYSQTKERFARLKGAQMNGFENVGFFAAAVVAGNLAGLSSRTLNGLSAGYVLSRVAYNVFYVSNTNPKLSDVRSALWLVGVAQCASLFIKART